MLIRRPVAEVFQAFIDPAVTTKFWFTRSSGRLTPGTTVTWDWEMYGVSTVVVVKEVEENSRILAEWDAESPTQIEWRFLPGEGAATLVRVTESGFSGTADEAVTKATDSMGGFTMVLCACKALLEQGVLLNAVADAHPTGFDA
ncbi:SRPBCC family protein [Micromonospora sp. HNM0581]|uniref:SRPBCC family protein n=1 Tax=Micromonospora sp. HNM0581 TaxID=2716341 RepID=UPI00197CB373|nr:SRPBCC family protein [Micromonospora sp. HNM0581]